MGNLCPAGRLSRTFRSVSRGWFGCFVVDVELRVNAAFPVLLLHAQHLPDQGCLAGVVRKAGVVARLVTGIARHLFLVTHRRILLNRLLWSAPGQIHCPAGPGRAHVTGRRDHASHCPVQMIMART